MLIVSITRLYTTVVLSTCVLSDAQIIEADVGAFSVKMKQLHDTGFTSLRVSTDRPYGIVIPGGGELAHGPFP